MFSETHHFGKCYDPPTFCMFYMTRPYSKSARIRANPHESVRIRTKNVRESVANPQA